MEACENPLTSLSVQPAPAAAGWLWQNAPPCSCERENHEWDKLALGFPHSLWAVSVEAHTGASWCCHLVWAAAEGMGWWRGDSFWKMETFTYGTEKQCLKKHLHTTRQRKKTQTNVHSIILKSKVSEWGILIFIECCSWSGEHFSSS